MSEWQAFGVNSPQEETFVFLMTVALMFKILGL